jgi:hypothetical protein
MRHACRGDLHRRSIRATQHAAIGRARPDPVVFNARETARYYHRLAAAA